MLQHSQNWGSTEDSVLSEASLTALLNNDIPSIRIKNFATSDECNHLVESAKKFGFDFYKNVSPPIGRIGITQFENKATKSEYFQKSCEANTNLANICSSNFNPVARLMEYLEKIAGFSACLAMENDQDRYFAGLIRQINTALLHIDYAPFDGTEWAIGKISSQLAWNLYLTPVEDGGECVVYNRPWRESDEKFKVNGSYGYDHEVIKAADMKKIKPVIGDLVFHNSRNYHLVNQGIGERLTISSFIGQYPDSKSLIFWS